MIDLTTEYLDRIHDSLMEWVVSVQGENEIKTIKITIEKKEKEQQPKTTDE